MGPEHVGDAEAADAVEGEETTAAQPVFIPTADMPDEQGEAEIQLRRTDQDELALPVFTSVANLVACCGEGQAWVVFRAETLPELVAATGATGIAQDQELPQETGDSADG